jgi:CRISPR-associated protein Cmr1
MSRSAPSVTEVFQEDAAIPEPQATATDTCTLTRHYRLITPLYGGGVEAGKPDLTKPINEKTVRGHLRFWWRATRGADEHVTKLLEKIKGKDQGAKVETSLLQDLGPDKSSPDFNNPEQRLKRLYTLESWLFGCSAEASTLQRHPSKRLGPSRVQVLAQSIHTPSNDDCVFEGWWEWGLNRNTKKSEWKWKSKHTVPAYAAFPFEAPKKDGDSKPKRHEVGKFNGEQYLGSKKRYVELLAAHVQFSIEVEAPTGYKTEIASALWAWETLGGVGARTRRGFGAFARTDADFAIFWPLQHDDEAVSYADLKAYVESGLEKHVINHSSENTCPPGVPRLSTDMSSIKLHPETTADNEHQDTIRAWTAWIETYKKFRQARPELGRSYWPEADHIRVLTKMHTAKHLPWQRLQQGTMQPIRSILSFPRAQFGLPIVFHFKDGADPEKEIRFTPEGTFDALAIAPQDPWDTTVQTARHDRLGSPLVLKPIRRGTHLACLALLFKNTGIQALLADEVESGLSLNATVFDPEGKRHKLVWKDLSYTLESTDASAIEPLKGRAQPTDVLEAFLDSLRGCL